MSDLISRQKAIEALDSVIVHTMGYFDDEKNIMNPFAQYNKGLEDGIKAICALPSAESEKKGYWIVKEEDWRKQLEWDECSECGFIATKRYNFCPNCGVDMW